MRGFTSALLCGAALTLGACAHDTSGLWASSAGEQRVDNSSLGGDLTLAQLDSRRAGQLLQGLAVLTSKTAKDQQLQYKFSWFDAQGYSLEDEGQSWKPVTLHGRQALQLVALAPNANAVRFEVYVRKTYAN
jgi:uncharacterized protein YcfL